jgi:hypothetical protein
MHRIVRPLRSTRPRARTLARAAIALSLAAAAAFTLGGLQIGAATPSTQSISVPKKAGDSATVTWTGTIPAVSAHPTNDCNGAGVADDDEGIAVTIPRKGYDRADATFTFKIAWTPSNPTGDETANDEVLTVNSPDGQDAGDTSTAEVGSSDGSATTETVVAHNLAPGTYHVLACGYVNSTPQDYQGSVTVETVARSATQSLASSDAQGLAFSAAVPADPQRDEAEPLVEIARDGHIYTCGPTGFSNGSDYAQVSTDGGDQFHILGTQPRGQQSAGGGGDCALATGAAKNASGNYAYAYAGLGALSGFATSTSADNGHSIATAGADANGGITSNGVLADRQWMVFTDDHTVLLSWNQQQPRNIVVQRSTDGGLTYSPITSVAAPDPEFPGPIRYIPSKNIAYMSWTKGEAVNLGVLLDGGTTWGDCKVASGDTVKGGTSGFSVADHDSAGNVYVVWSDSADYHTWLSVVTAAQLAACTQSTDAVAATADGEPTLDVGASASIQVDRDAVRTTVFPWVSAGGAPGRVAVAFYGATADGDPNSVDFNAAWNVYVNQSLNALDSTRTFSQVQATTHPMHYDSICLNGLGCDIAVPPGDRGLADFFAIGYDPSSGRLSVVFDRDNKKPDDDLGHVATPMVSSQIAGPSNNGGTIAVANHAVVRSSSSDPGGDALSNYSLTAPGVAPPSPPTKNEAAADFTSAAIGPDAASGGFTVTLKVANLSTAALTQALTDTAGQSLVWIWRFANGYQDSAASVRWNPVQGFTFGWNDYTVGAAPCEGITNAAGQSEKCVVYPGGQPLAGRVDQLTGTITLVVPRSYLRQLSGADADGRPLEQPAATGARFYDGTAFSFANNAGATQDSQSFLTTLDSTPALDFLLP